MDSRSNFLLQILHKLGAPLMRAVSAHPDVSDSAAQKDAQTIAALLSETVKISITLSQAMNLKPEDGNADAIRVSLATLVGNLVADSYAQNGRIPGEAETRRISSGLQSILSFSDNFAPASEHSARLMTLEGSPPFLDPMQTGLYAMNALIPAIGAIAEFPFGQVETKLIQDVSSKLAERARALREKLTTISGDGPEAKMAELVILQSLAQIYAGAHRAETARLNSLSEAARGDLSLDPVWQNFDRQLAMLEVLIGASGDPASSSGKGGGGVKPAVETPSAEVQTPAAPSEGAATPPAKPANPMSFFKKS